MALMEEWSPPSDWSENGDWEPLPMTIPPKIPTYWLMHLFENDHTSRLFLTKKQWMLSILESFRKSPSTSQEPDIEMHAHPRARMLPADIVLKSTPKKTLERLCADPSDPPLGWGLYVEEGVFVPRLLDWISGIVVLAVLIYCGTQVQEQGFVLFGVWGNTIAALGQLAYLQLTALGIFDLTKQKRTAFIQKLQDVQRDLLYLESCKATRYGMKDRLATAFFDDMLRKRLKAGLGSGLVPGFARLYHEIYKGNWYTEDELDKFSTLFTLGKSEISAGAFLEYISGHEAKAVEEILGENSRL
ncbi:hypothetical protein H2199_002604 [Coniosporium tulheliwenetii]|uniref:Uncharacterized protein n=1 Tax=Coniosporium tulheliwenetii TaxID=3383036 RepID=A0ACC2ZFI7_9PEZI|nr:hypothetical protein H2199_002604 [Cladosporium sp. JES 115]